MASALTVPPPESAIAPPVVFSPSARDPRAGLRMSATLATVFTLLGHTVLGFEQPVVYVVVAVLTGYGCAVLFEWVDAVANARPPGFAGRGGRGVVDFLLAPHMTSITMSFLLYSNERLWVLAFAVAAAIGSKYLFRVRIDGRHRHFFNPSNFGVCTALFLFRYTSQIPWNFTETLPWFGQWLVPLVIVGLGTRLNLLFTRRVPLIVAWLVTFCAQGIARALWHGAPVAAELLPLTGVPMVLFTFYMITDPQTTPRETRGQVLFGAAIALVYGIFMEVHLIFTMFFAVALVAGARGTAIALKSALAQDRHRPRREHAA